MNKTRLKKLQVYIDRCLVALGLTEWEIRVSPEPVEQTDDEIVFASIIVDEPYRIGTLKFGEPFFARTPEQQKKLIAHELTHIWLSRLRDQPVIIKPYLTPNVYDVWMQSFYDAEEYAVEQISRLLVGALPEMVKV